MTARRRTRAPHGELTLTIPKAEEVRFKVIKVKAH
jgi:hypothetical protein